MKKTLFTLIIAAIALGANAQCPEHLQGSKTTTTCQGSVGFGDELLSSNMNNGCTYEWSTGAVTPRIIVPSELPTGPFTGLITVWVEITNVANTCTITDTFKVTFFPPVAAIAVNNASPTVTPGQSFTFQVTPQSSYLGYQWRNRSVLLPGELQPNFTTSTPGNYSVTVTDQNGCEGSRTVTLNN